MQNHFESQSSAVGQQPHTQQEAGGASSHRVSPQLPLCLDNMGQHAKVTAPATGGGAEDAAY